MQRRLIYAFLVGLLFVSPAAKAVPPSVKITPHRAIYKMSLAENRQSSQIIDASGTMEFSWNDACDGWTNEQKLQMKYYYAQGQVLESTLSNASWESKDGKRYSFTARNSSNSGTGNGTYRGMATLSSNGGKVRYSAPEEQQKELKAGTMFPNQHTASIIDHAQRGVKMPNTIVFDGGDEDGQSEISIFIGKPSPTDISTLGNDKLLSNPMLQGQAWPVRMAFYPLSGNDTGMPNYEMTMDLLPNGIARRVLVDYGDFSVRGILNKIEALPDSGC